MENNNKPLINLIGSNFGDLTVITQYKKDKKYRCICKCSCGNEVDVDKYYLINGKKTHCGCKAIKKRPERIKGLTGQKFGRLTVLERDNQEYFTKGGNRLYMWLCQCECGNVISVERGKLKSGHTKSCGCLGAEKHKIKTEEYLNRYKNLKDNDGCFKDITNKRFGKLIALYKDGYEDYNGRKIPTWTCKCDCGNILSVTRSNLVSNHTQSCGCIDSVGESTIGMILNDCNITFKKEYTFDECRNIHKLPFDFGVYDANNNLLGLIEFDGLQHFQKVRFNGMTEERAEESFKNCIKHDKIKNSFCKNNNIPLLRIKYTDIANLKDLILPFLKDIKNVDRGDTCA